MLTEIWSGVWCQPESVEAVFATHDKRLVIYFRDRSDSVVWPAAFATELDAANAAKEIAGKINEALRQPEL